MISETFDPIPGLQDSVFLERSSMKIPIMCMPGPYSLNLKELFQREYS